MHTCMPVCTHLYLCMYERMHICMYTTKHAPKGISCSPVISQMVVFWTDACTCILSHLHSEAQYIYHFPFPLYVMCESQKVIIHLF
jgi:hypothetical protein